MEVIQDGPIFIDVSSGQELPSEELVQDPELETVRNDDENYKPEVDMELLKKTEDPYLRIQKRRIRCPECYRYTAENEEKMQRHIRKVHRGENPFQCSMCDYSTYNKSMFEEHVRIHQGIKPFKCSKCPYRSVSKKNTKKHELIHRPNNPLKCTHCDFIARHSRSFLCHIKKHAIEEKLDDSEAMIKCLKCDQSYKRSAFKEHQKANEDCKRCSFTSCSKALLSRHMTKMHGEERRKRLQEATFTCAICEWSSRNRPRILLHLIHHPDQYIDENVIDVTVLKKHGIIK
ncbi:unnamed protein product [Parnassius apollo]|uniref:(apollo) hypothetical protein n=1 Tax=Parnassius apollo TaxID=110799 RepID=A0A8S3WC55_PARAO|nr:unnamed protein product [Parnassius apollo]